MRSIAVLCFALIAAVLSKSTDAFLVPTGSVGGTKLPASPLIAQQRRPASTQPNDLVVLSAGFFGGGGGNNQNNSDKDQRRAPGGEKISKERRAQLGINADEDEYDLYYALDQNTDPIMTKVIAGSFILVMIALLVYAVVIPSLTVYDEGVCSIVVASILTFYIWTSIYSIEFLLFSQPNSERWPVLAGQVETIICSVVACMLLLT